MIATLVDGRLSTVVIPCKLFDAANDAGDFYELLHAIVVYVLDVERAGVYARHELPLRAVQAFNVAIYSMEVDNGGHSQFLANRGAQLPTTLADTLAGLEAMARTPSTRT